MNLNLSHSMIETITDLHRISNGQPNVFYPAIDVHHSTLSALYRRGLICIEKRSHGGRVVRYASLTSSGVDLFVNGIGINANDVDSVPKRQRFTIGMQFDMKHAEHRFAMGQVERLKSERKFTPTIIQLLTLNEELERGDVTNFKNIFPEAYDALRREFENKVLHETFASYMTELEKIKETVSANFAPQQIGQSPSAANLSGGLKPIATKPIVIPTYDDEDEIVLQVKADSNSGKKSAQNFINSINSLQRI